MGTSWFIIEHNLQGALLTANNLSDLTNAGTARTNLGLAIGTNVQAFSSNLALLAAPTATTKGDLLSWSGSAWVRVFVGPAGTSPVADPAQTTGWAWGALTSYTTQTISASGDTNLTTTSARHAHNLTISGATSGNGARVPLTTAGRVAGDTVSINATFAADASRLRIYNATTGGTLLLDQTNDSTARKFAAVFTYTGAVAGWELSSGGYYA